MEKVEWVNLYFNQRRRTMLNRATIISKIKPVIMGTVAVMMLTASPLIPWVSAAHAPQLKEMIEKGDHAGLAEFYKKRAEEARHNAEDMKTMQSDYLKKYPKNTYAKHCEKMADNYRKQAKHYDELAEMHKTAK